MVSHRKRPQFKAPPSLDTRQCTFWHRFSYWIYGEAPADVPPRITETPATDKEGDGDSDDQATSEARRAADALEHLERQRQVRIIR